MRRHAALILAGSFFWLGGPSSRPTLAAPAGASDLEGTWKLVVLPYGDDEFLVFDIKANDGKLEGAVVSTQAMLGSIKAAEGTVEGDRVTVRFPGQGDTMEFRGTVDQDKKAKGTVRYRGTSYPARIEKTDARKVAPMQPSPLRQKLAQAQAVADPKERVARILELIQESPGHPMNASAYASLLGSAEAAGLGADEVRAKVERWVDEAKPYGPEWTADVQVRALKALQGKKAYAATATELAQAAEKAMPVSYTQLRAHET
jgi:hypothetical protein